MLASGTTIFSHMVVRLLTALSVLSAVQCQSYPCPENMAASASVFEVPQHKTYCWYRVILQDAPTQQETKYFLQVSKKYQQCCIYDPKTSCTKEFACFYSYWIGQKGLEEVRKEMLSRVDESLNPVVHVKTKPTKKTTKKQITTRESNERIKATTTTQFHNNGDEIPLPPPDYEIPPPPPDYEIPPPPDAEVPPPPDDEIPPPLPDDESSETETDALTAETESDEISETTFILLVVALVVACVVCVGLIYVVMKRKKHQKKRRNKNGKSTEHSSTSGPSSTSISTGNTQIDFMQKHYAKH